MVASKGSSERLSITMWNVSTVVSTLVPPINFVVPSQVAVRDFHGFPANMHTSFEEGIIGPRKATSISHEFI